MEVKLTVNNKVLNVSVDPDEMLLDTLRKNRYTGVKRGCDTTNCGLCTVWVDEKPVLSCSTLTAKAHNRNITTIEGLQEEAREFGKFMMGEGAEQCGYCSPGFVMTVLAMKRELENPTDEEITHYITGNLCRCSGYVGQLRAIKKFLEVK